MASQRIGLQPYDGEWENVGTPAQWAALQAAPYLAGLPSVTTPIEP